MLAVVTDSRASHVRSYALSLLDLATPKTTIGRQDTRQEKTDRPVYSCPYPPTAEAGKGGQLLWLSGANGAGKTTIAAALAETGNWAAYEGDCFLFHLNPYTDTPPNGVPGRGWRPERFAGVPADEIVACKRALQGLKEICSGATVDCAMVWAPFYRALCADVIRERARLGPGWNLVVSQAVFTREARDLVRSLLGPNLRFVVLDIPIDLQAERLCARFKMRSMEAVKSMKRFCHGFEPAAEDEVGKRTLSLQATSDKSVATMTAEIQTWLNRDF